MRYLSTSCNACHSLRAGAPVVRWLLSPLKTCMTFRIRSGQRHTTREHLYEVVVEYPHHPLAGRRIPVVRRCLHAGLVHFVVDGPDGCRALLPAWMTESHAATLPIVAIPRLSLSVFSALRDLVRAHCVTSSASDETIRREASDEGTAAALHWGGRRCFCDRSLAACPQWP